MNSFETTSVNEYMPCFFQNPHQGKNGNAYVLFDNKKPKMIQLDGGNQ